MRKLGKKYVEASQKVEPNKAYTYIEAIKLAKDTAITKFDSTVEVAMKLNVDPKKADQQLRGAIVLPNGTGKTKKTLVLAKGEAAAAATKAGADFVGEMDLIDKIANENWFDFDIIIATPEMMPALGKIGKVLGPKGLMPNPKSGTVTPNPAKAVEDAMNIIEGTARNMGIAVKGVNDQELAEQAEQAAIHEKEMAKREAELAEMEAEATESVVETETAEEE